MKIILDTHTFLWFINDSTELSNSAAELIESDVDLWISIASLWEISIKVNLNKLDLPDDYEKFIPHQIAINNIEILPVNLQHLIVLTKLPLHHRDPFDRLLIAQAIAEEVPIISIDKKFDLYEVDRQW
ncbi:type II toxin-antitoxin system VapC family toxin [Pseudanabaena sp. BC1403]|uniref:type II toxin-antitoxin system VapC family toxin n=1 Tax=Pseudanabaena sp. BC1403 TaxID=2043171 RepID=UPI000CD8D2FB|nr:type II toxin-antitoxin system VapC family toxin [Pseudanabaena sp. BC1403]